MYFSCGISWQRLSKMGPLCGKLEQGEIWILMGLEGLHICHSISWYMGVASAMVPADAVEGRGQAQWQDVSSVGTSFFNYCACSLLLLFHLSFLPGTQRRRGGDNNWLSADSGGKLDRQRKENPLWDATFWSSLWSVQWPKQSHCLLLPPLPLWNPQ